MSICGVRAAAALALAAGSAVGRDSEPVQPAAAGDRVAHEIYRAAQLHADHLQRDLRSWCSASCSIRSGSTANRKGAVAANWHESTTVEIVWTIIPFLIIIVMAMPATTHRGGDEGHQQRRPDHQGDRLPVEVGLRLPTRRGRGHRLPVAAGHAARADRRRNEPKTHQLPDRGRPSLWSCRSTRRCASSRPRTT